MANYRFVEALEDPFEIVEDEDGFRILQFTGRTVPKRVWDKAYADSVALLLSDTTDAQSAEEFEARRIEHATDYEMVGARVMSPNPSYKDYLAEQSAAAKIDPLENSQFVHLHTHTEYSTLDGLSNVREIMETISKDPNGGGAVGSCDHGNCAAHPEWQALADEFGIKPIFGMEAYFVPDRFRRTSEWYEFEGMRVDPKNLSDAERKKAERKTDSKETRSEYMHLSLWAIDDVGLRNLWAMSTEAYRDGLFDGKPRLDWDTLERHSEGIVCGTGCLRGPVARPLLAEEGKTPDPDLAQQNLMRLHGIFGDNLYIEIHTNQLDQQVEVNRQLLAMSETYGIPPLAAVDSHYSVPEHKQVHKTWVAMQTGKTLVEDTTMFQGDQDYHLKTAEEVAASLAYLPDQFVYESMQNTVKVARLATAKVGGEVTTPTYSNATDQHPDPVAWDVERLIDICLANWERKVLSRVKAGRHTEAEYMARFEREMALLIDKGFCGYFLIVWDYVKWAKSEGCLVGPGRGSGGGSLVAYLADIVEIDPVDSDLIFERFLTEGRKSLPDFDIDFPTSWRTRIINYLIQRWGEDYVSNIGTVTRLRVKAALNDVVRVMTPVLPYEVSNRDFEVVKKAVTEADRALAGKHMPWDEFQAQYADLVDPMRSAYSEIFDVVDVAMDRVKTYGKHAAGVVISTGAPLTDLPMRLAEDSATKQMVLVTQFDMNALELLGYVKFDILTLRTLDTLQAAIDLIDEKLGRRIDPYEWTDEYEDPQVWDEVSAGRTLGLFQIETPSGTRLTKRMQPSNLFDLAAVMTVVRPGPMRSGLTESYLRRRAGLEQVTYPDPRLEDFLGDTYGSMIYQEQVMATCMNLAGYDSTEADVVRKLLGKKQVEKVQAAGVEFIRRAVECDTAQEVAEHLWTQMAEFAKYGFNKAHAFGYAVLGYWCAFLRFHYPAEFLVAALSTVDMDRIPEFIEDCRRCGYTVLPPDINRSKVDFIADGIEVVYGLADIKGMGAESAGQVVSLQPYSSLEDFTERHTFSGSKINAGHIKTLVSVGAFDGLVDNRRAVEIQLERESSGEAKRCKFKVEGPVNHPEDYPAPDVCSFFWPGEENPPMLPKGRGKAKVMVAKPPPKKCTVACRQYTKPEPISASDVAPYSNEEIMHRERELLGVWISHSPFEVVQDTLDNPPPEVGRLWSAQEIESAPITGDLFTAIVLVEQVKQRTDVTGRTYAFVKMNIQDGEIEAICFASLYEQHHDIAKDRLAGVQILKTPKGYQLADYVAMN